MLVPVLVSVLLPPTLSAEVAAAPVHVIPEVAVDDKYNLRSLSFFIDEKKGGLYLRPPFLLSS